MTRAIERGTRKFPREAWPAHIRSAWAQATRKRRGFGDRGAGLLAAKSAQRLAALEDAYGRFLEFRLRCGVDLESHSHHLTEEALGDWVEHLHLTHRTKSIATWFECLDALAHGLWPAEDWTVLRGARRRLESFARQDGPRRRRNHVDRDTIYQAGMTIMDSAMTKEVGVFSACEFRNGLMLALAATAPARAVNWHRATPGHFNHDASAVEWGAHETKNRCDLAYELGEELAARLTLWIEVYRQFLIDRYQTAASTVFVNRFGRDLSRRGVRQVFEKTAERVLPHRITWHDTRACVVNTILREMPEAVEECRALLGHRSDTAIRHYKTRASMIGALRRFRDLSEQRRWKHRGQPRPRYRLTH